MIKTFIPEFKEATDPIKVKNAINSLLIFCQNSEAYKYVSVDQINDHIILSKTPGNVDFFKNKLTVEKELNIDYETAELLCAYRECLGMVASKTQNSNNQLIAEKYLVVVNLLSRMIATNIEDKILDLKQSDFNIDVEKVSRASVSFFNEWNKSSSNKIPVDNGTINFIQDILKNKSELFTFILSKRLLKKDITIDYCELQNGKTYCLEVDAQQLEKKGIPGQQYDFPRYHPGDNEEEEELEEKQTYRR